MSRTDDKYLKQLQVRYRKASKKERSVILDEFVMTTGYHRKYAIAVLNGRRGMIGLIRRFVLQYMVTAPDCCAMGWDTNCTSNHGSGHFYAAYIGVSTHVLPIVRAAWCSLFSWCRQITRPFHHCIQLLMKYIGLRRRYVYPYARVPILKRLHGLRGIWGIWD